MGYHVERSDFVVSVDGTFVQRGRWLVRGSIEYRPRLSGATLSRVIPEARLKLMVGIVREARHGREQGARRVDVLVHGDAETSGFFEILARDGAPLEAA